MTEKLKQEGQVPQGESTNQEGQDPIIEKAMEMGWRPKEEFEGDENEWIDAGEFVRRRPLFDKIESLSKAKKHQDREIQEVKQALRLLQEHHAKVAQKSYEQALQDLRKQHKAALEEGNADAVVEITERIADVKAEEKAQSVRQQNVPQQPHPEFVAWVERNSWYAQDTELRMTADSMGTAYAANHPELHPTEVLNYVETRIKRTFPEKFTNTNRMKPSPVDGGNSTTKKTKEPDYELTEEERKAMNTFVRQGIMTKEQYLKELRG